MPKLSRDQWTIIGVVGGVVLIAVLLFTGIIPGFVQRQADLITLNFTGFENRVIYDPIIQRYQQKHPNITINYKQIDFNNYENILINSLAAGAGPDIFMFHNSWLPKHFDKITPVSEAQLPLSQFETLYPTVVRQDFAPSGVVFALPLYIDTLALFYNKDSFDQAGIATPPTNWVQFQNAVERLKTTDTQDNLTRPAAAIGGSTRNIHKAPDILNLLFLQSGTPMVESDFSRANFASLGLSAFNFYLSFSNPLNRYYTWNDQLPFSLDLFAQGQLPMMFHYRYQVPLLKQRAPYLEFTVAPAPQPSTAGPVVSYADYYGLAVSGSSYYSKEAWDFIAYLTINPEIAQMYLNATGQSPAIRSMIKQAINDPELGVFASQALTARSWPQPDKQVIDQIFAKMINSILEDGMRYDQALREAEDEVTQLMRLRR
ncbi:MAG: extracellular solute-binding protein [Patescibacteria group bacterium]